MDLKNFFKTLKLNEPKISTVLGGLVVVVVAILIYNYFTGINKQASQQAEQEAAREAAQAAKTHTVVKGEHLWSIAVKYYQDGYKWAEVAKANKLTNPDRIETGQVLTLPELTESKPVSEQTLSPSEYTVKTGDHLWKIAVTVYADGYQWPKIWQANKTKITNPDIIETGMVLTIPR